MRRIRYQVACSLDGYIAGPQGEFDWIVQDPAVDFGAMFAQFDTLLMGRRTYEVARGGPGLDGMRIVVISTTLRPDEHPGVEIVSRDVAAQVGALRAESGKDIWLFGGGALFRSLLALGLVDGVEAAVIPILLGGGVPFLPAPAVRQRLRLTGHRVYPSGIVALEYAVAAAGQGPAGASPGGAAGASQPQA